MQINPLRSLRRAAVGLLIGLLAFLFLPRGDGMSLRAAGPDGLQAWSALNIAGLNSATRVYALRRAGNVVLAGTQGQGLFRSTDGGTSWQALTAYNTAYVRDVWLSADGQIALAATYGSGLLRSVNAGATWSVTGSNITTSLYYAFAAAGDTLFVATAERGVWRSADNGATWQATGTLGSPGAVTLVAASPSVVYAGTVNDGLYRSNNSGTSWQRLQFSGKTVRALAVDPRNPQVIWASVLNDGLYRSSDGGASWSAAGSGLNNASVLSLLFVSGSNGDYQLSAGTAGNGVFQWNGTAWQAAGLSGLDVYNLSRWAQTAYAGTSSRAWEYTTPGLLLLTLRNDPLDAPEPGDEILYTIEYRNGSTALTELEISNVIPQNVVLVAGSISAGGSATGSAAGSVVRWPIGNLAANAAGRVSYRVQRPPDVPTPTPTTQATATRTPTPIPTTQATATRTPTPIPTTQATATWTPTPTAQATATWTPTPTPTTAPPVLAIDVTLSGTPDPATVGATIRYLATIVDTGGTGFSQITLADAYHSTCVVIANGQIWPPTSNGTDSAQWDNIGALTPSGTMQFWIDFLAVEKCNGVQNENIVTVTGTYQGYQIVDSAMLRIKIENALAASENAVQSPAAPVIVVNAGATASWRAGGQTAQLVSNRVVNPGARLYLPVALRKP
ncbi:MAG: hypothetical protein ABTQ73_08965 [Caldilineales bacterium]